MTLKLPDSVASSQDIKTMLLEVREYAKWFSHAAIKERLGMTYNVKPPALSPTTDELLRTIGSKKQLTPQSLDELIATLEHFDETAPTITITLAAAPTSSLKKTLVGWCRANIAPNILVSFQFSSSLLGGMVVRHGSRIFDWSFRRQILDNSAKFPEALRNV